MAREEKTLQWGFFFSRHFVKKKEEPWEILFMQIQDCQIGIIDFQKQLEILIKQLKDENMAKFKTNIGGVCPHL